MAIDFDQLKKGVRDVSGDQDADALEDVQNMVDEGVLGMGVSYEQSVTVRGEKIVITVKEETSKLEADVLVEEFIEKIRAALTATPKPEKTVVPPAPPTPEKYETELSPEDQEYLLKLIDRQYQEALDTVSLTLDATKNEKAPDIGAVKRAVLKTLKHEQVVEIQSMRESTLLIVPSLSPERLIKTVNSQECRTMPNQIDGVFYEPYPEAVRAVAKDPTTFRFAITEGKQHFDAQPTDKDAAFNQRIPMKTQERIGAFEAYCKTTKMCSLDALAYMLLMIRGLRNKMPTDRISDTSCNFTLLPGEFIDARVNGGLVAAGCWNSNYRHPFFGNDGMSIEVGRARLRAAVMAEI